MNTEHGNCLSLETIKTENLINKIYTYKCPINQVNAERRLVYFSSISGIDSVIPEFEWHRVGEVFYTYQKIVQRDYNPNKKSSLRLFATKLDEMQLRHYPHGDINLKNIIFSNNNFFLVDVEPVLEISISSKQTYFRSTFPYVHNKDIEQGSISILSDLLGFLCYCLRINGFSFIEIKARYKYLCLVAEKYIDSSRPFTEIINSAEQILIM